MASIPVTIYGASRCSLCDKAAALLAHLAPELGLAVEHVDIRGDAALEAAYRLEIPVVFVAGGKAYIYRVDEDDLRRRVERLRAQ